MAEWNPNQYLKFKGERTQPSYDLANRIPLEKAEKIIDIGCGPGNSTRVLAEKYPQAYILGVDNSQEMVDTARKQCPGLNFMLFDAEKDFPFIQEKFDIVFSNACIQWVPDHERLLKNMMGLLKDGGILAVQIPNNYEEPIHKILIETSESEKWSNKIGKPRFFIT